MPPHKYEVIRDKLAKGAPVNSPQYNRAQSEAAAIYNKHRGFGVKPLTSKSK